MNCSRYLWLYVALLCGCQWLDDAGAPPHTDMNSGGTDLLSAVDQVVSPNPCALGDSDPTCHQAHYGAPGRFALAMDPMRDPLEHDSGIRADAEGHLAISGTGPRAGFLWIPNSADPNAIGSISKIDVQTIREVARYLPITCSSLPGGSSAACDGTTGCCSNDDPARFAARQAHLPEPGHQKVEVSRSFPSRTAVDDHGDVLVGNRGYSLQSSVTRIARDVSECIDRNHNGRIDTSSDVNGNGWIESDCNGDGMEDDLASVQKQPCTNGLAQEFYGLDDECVLWTTNVFAPGGGSVRGLALAKNNRNTADAWVSAVGNTTLVRIDAITGITNGSTTLPPDCATNGAPWGMVVDAQGIGWVNPHLRGTLCYFDTRSPATTGVVRNPDWGLTGGEGITLDRDQNVWVGWEVARYTPDRSNGSRNVGNGWWTRTSLTGIGIAADSRNGRDHFVYSCSGGGVKQIPASKIPVTRTDGFAGDDGWPMIRVPCMALAIDSAQNLWGVDYAMNTRVLIDLQGKMTPPKVGVAPMGKDRCPAGDQCPNLGAEAYGDFATDTWSAIGIPAPAIYSMLVPGCRDAMGNPADTEWLRVTWDADTTAGTSLTVVARAGNSSDLANDPLWQSRSWTPDWTESPLELRGLLPGNYTPGAAHLQDGWLQVQFTLKTGTPSVTPQLKSFDVAWRCPRG